MGGCERSTRAIQVDTTDSELLPQLQVHSREATGRTRSASAASRAVASAAAAERASCRASSFAVTVADSSLTLRTCSAASARAYSASFWARCTAASRSRSSASVTCGHRAVVACSLCAVLPLKQVHAARAHMAVHGCKITFFCSEIGVLCACRSGHVAQCFGKSAPEFQDLRRGFWGVWKLPHGQRALHECRWPAQRYLVLGCRALCAHRSRVVSTFSRSHILSQEAPRQSGCGELCTRQTKVRTGCNHIYEQPRWACAEGT